MLLDRQKKIIEYLKNNLAWIKGSELGKIIDVTDRTIRSDINSIKKVYGEDLILSSRKNGYQYNPIYLNKEKVVLNQDISGQEDRIIYIIKELLIHEDGVSIYDLAEKLFVSEFSIEADITKIKKIVNDLNLDKVNIFRNGEYIIVENSKKYASNLLYDIAKYEIHDLDVEDIKKYFNDVDIELLVSIINEVFLKYKYVSRYLSKMNLIIDIAISIERSRIYNSHKIVKNFYEEIEFDLFKLSTEMVRKIEDSFQVNISESTILNLANNLYRIKKIEIVENEVRKNNVEESKIYRFYLNILEQVKINSQVDLTNNKQFIRDIALHTEIAIERLRLGIKLYNPLTDQLRSQFPFIFNIAIQIAKEISEENEVEFDLHETSYLVAYIGSAIRQVRESENLNILLVVLEGASNLSYIYDQIIKLNKNANINLVGVSSLYELEELKSFQWNFDLIISTSVIPNINCDNNLIIKSSFALADRVRVKEIILKKIESLGERQFEEIFSSFFSEGLFIRNLDAQNREDAINKLVNILKDNYYVEDGFEESVLEREKFISTSIDTGVALPHALKRQAKKSGLIIGILNNAISWEENKVKVIMLTALGKEEVECLNSYNEFITDIALNKEIVESIRKTNSFTAFKQILRDFYIENLI